MSNLDLSKNMAQLIRENPQLAGILRNRGIDCGSCLASQVDTLADVVRTYNLDLGELLLELERLGTAG
ncbi:MAG: hypothetical protein HQL84_13455 [Magnetococcales bacterium]|nr:hypothetical protein [Magnetococcales bacterium]MBF0151041.1 hypothetical protein [Magnetococcales bacterium]MBF0173114.1 hypothetical protein [Magnetococcales bacterium]MBF0346235.1 hypothetical protein [Magnetococcales bacterium]MBF0632849.1 hypothetical protein [Magnetococcales bacterium]